MGAQIVLWYVMCPIFCRWPVKLLELSVEKLLEEDSVSITFYNGVLDLVVPVTGETNIPVDHYYRGH